MDLSDPGTLRRFLDRHGLLAKKSLGQHFLCSSKVVSAIVNRVEGFGGVLEIGPGPGVLTGPLSEQVGRTIALELDPRMPAALAESAPKAEVVAGDALKEDLGKLLVRLPRSRAVISNLPYYITGPLLTRIAEVREHFDRVVLMMQKEVGVRVQAPPGNSDRGSLSVFMQAQFEISRIIDAPAGAFLPPPKVDSVVLEFEPRPEKDPAAFFALVRKAFAQPRKTLLNNLRAAGFEPDLVVAALGTANVDARARPADLSLEQWRELFAELARVSPRSEQRTQ